MILYDVLHIDGLRAAIEERFVVRREHPSQPLAILNYTDRCQWEKGAWNDVTRACRGIIYRTDTLEVVARPFRKFFNYGQSEAPTLDLTGPATVTDKLDGSLGILYPTSDGYAIATRGSFESDQAAHATDVLRSRYPEYVPPDGLTVLFEIVYPENRIVLDYGKQDDLVLLGAVAIATGKSVGPYCDALTNWPGPRAALFECRTLADALAVPPRTNAEGLVVHCLASDERVKIKQGDYVALHRIVTGLNERTVWEHLSAGRPLSELMEPLPDEFHAWVSEVAAGLVAKVNADAAEVEHAYSMILATLPEDFSRKDFAAQAVRHDRKHSLFLRLDGKDYRPNLWANAKPEALRGPRAFSEDTA